MAPQVNRQSYYGLSTLGLVLILLSAATNGELVKVIELTNEWTLANNNLSWVKTNLHIPSGVYSALYDEDVLESDNDVKLRWVAYDKWTYSRTFTVPQTLMNVARLCNLTFHGIDTIAEIRLNHHIIGRTDNMFVRYSYEIMGMLKQENLLEVEISSPVIAARDKAEKFKMNNTMIPPLCPSDRYHGECHVNMLRKMQSSFSWDWAPGVPSMGIWKPVTLEFYEVALLRDVDVAASKNDTHWNMQVRVYLDAGGEKDFYADLKLYAFGLLDEPIFITDYSKTHLSYRNPVISFEQAVNKSNVVMWWPNGYGEQKLYNFNFVLTAWLNDGGAKREQLTISQKSISFGFRTVELVQQEVVKGGGFTFMFKVNNIEMFMKGANYMPSHILPEFAQNKERVKYLITSAKDIHLNMLRVWGGGVYESDYFYELADQHGILIWQDMMFANAMYPVTAEFLASVRLEISQNAKRIAYHPCVAVFAANSENELALSQNWFGTLREQKRFDNEYRELYIGNVLQELKIVQHASRPVPMLSSPSNGKREEFYNYVALNPQDWKYGDVHFFSTNDNALNVEGYPMPRFVSQYGFQSLPQMESWKRSLIRGNNLMEIIRHRQHHPMAMLPIINLIRFFLPLPMSKDDRYTEALIYFSQIAQAMATKLETEKYRGLRDTDHHTMGALYWHLNDVWIAPSWSSIDFFGNYKLLHYWAKNFMAPVIIIAHYDSHSKSINVSVACDLLEVPADGAEIIMNVHMWSSFQPKNKTSWPVMLKANGVTYEKAIPIDSVLVQPYNEQNTFLEFKLQRAQELMAFTYYFPEGFQHIIGVGNPELSVDIHWKYCSSVNELNNNNYVLKIIAKKPAIFVYIEIVHPEVKKYKLSQNGFMQLVPVMLVELTFQTEACIIITQANVQIKTVNEFIIKK